VAKVLKTELYSPVIYLETALQTNAQGVKVRYINSEVGGNFVLCRGVYLFRPSNL